MSALKMVAYADSNATSLLPKVGDSTKIITVVNDAERKSTLPFVLKRAPAACNGKARIVACRSDLALQAFQAEGLISKPIFRKACADKGELEDRVKGQYEPMAKWAVLASRSNEYDLEKTKQHLDNIGVQVGYRQRNFCLVSVGKTIFRCNLNVLT